MSLAPWIIIALLVIVILVLASKLRARGRGDEAAATPVHDAVLARSLPPPAAPLDPNAAKLPPRVTSIRAPAKTLSSAAGARAAAKAAIGRRDIRGAVAQYQEAGLIDEAVSLLVGVLGAPAEAAAMLSKHGDHARAADLFELAGKRAKAAREWALVAEHAPESSAYLRRVRRLDPGLADALSASQLDSFDVYDAPTRQIQVVLAEMPPPVDEDEAEEMATDSSPAEMPEDEIESMATAAAEAATRVFDSIKPASAEDEPSGVPTSVVTRPSIERSSTAPTWTDGIEEDDPEGLGPSVLDTEIVRAGVAIPLWDLEAMTRDQPCDLSNIEVFHRIGMAQLAIGNWVAALAAFDAVEETSPGYRDAEARAEQVRAWQLCLGSRRTLDDGRVTVLGRFEEREDTIVYRVRQRAAETDALLHVPRSGPMPDFEQRAEDLTILDHPNLTRVLSTVALGEGGALVSETADGPTLSARIALGPRPTVVDALRIAAQLCEALESAGDRGGAQIDPDDLRVTAGGLVKLMRWGWPDTQRPGALHAPEDETAGADGRALVSAVGAVLVLALSGDVELARTAHTDATWTAIDKAAPYLPAAVRAVARRATALDPNDRFPSIKGLRLALRNLLKQVQRRASSMTIPAVRA